MLTPTFKHISTPAVIHFQEGFKERITGACVIRVLVFVPAVSQDFLGPLPSLPASNMALKGQSESQALTLCLARYGYHSSPAIPRASLEHHAGFQAKRFPCTGT